MNVETYAFDVIDRLRSVQRSEAVASEMQKVMSDFGFSAFMVTGIPRPGDSMQPLVLSVHWPEGWKQRYMANGYDRVDPTVHKVRSSLRPFRWTSVVNPKLTREEARVMGEATEFGLNDGLVVPIHDLDGLEAGISFGCDRLDVDDRHEAALHLIGLYAYECLRRQAGSGAPKTVRRQLSARERECVQWTAAGKSAWDIGQILGISAHTVGEYLASAAQKMNTRTRPQLVARCFREGLIN